MRSLLDALQEGRLVELPDSNKEEALEILALLIEAIPDIGTKTDLVKAVRDREAQFNTGIGKGVAVPHCRVNYSGELLCAIGWSPGGIDYTAVDGKPVHLVVMYYVPDDLRNMYLKEISGLAKVLESSDSIESMSQLPDIQSVRNHLLDWVSQAISGAVPDAKARMIQLDARQAILEHTAPPGLTAITEHVARFIPFKLVNFGDHHLILTADEALVDTLEHSDDLKANLNAGADFDAGGYRIAVLSETDFSHGRKLVEAVAFKKE